MGYITNIGDLSYRGNCIGLVYRVLFRVRNSMQIGLNGLAKQILSVVETTYMRGQIRLERMGIELLKNDDNLFELNK